MQLRFQAGNLTHKSERAVKRVARLLRPILLSMAGIAADVAATAMGEEKLAKAAWNVDDVVNSIIDALWVEFEKIPDEVRLSLMDAATQGVLQMKPQIKNTDMIADANEVARLWADDRAAELVGMRWKNGVLIKNPNAEFAITNTVRERLNSIITGAFEKVTPFEDILDDIEEMNEFSEARAEMIARTEISRAQIQGNIAVWDATGMVKTYDWLKSEDEDVCEECEAFIANGPYEFGIGPMPIEDSHPNCRCIIVSNELELPEDIAAALESNLTKSTEAASMPKETTTIKVGQEHFFLAMPITKFDEELRIVEGIATAEVMDSQGDIVDFERVCKAFGTWEGNVREQHDKTKAVGRAVSFTPIPETKEVGIAVHISRGAQDTWEKVKDGTLKYFSIGCPFGSYERKAEVIKMDGVDKKANRLLINALSEVSLVDQGSCPVAKIGLWKTEDGASDVLDTAEEADEEVDIGLNGEIIKLTDDAGNYADPGWQEDKQKRYPLDTEEHVRAAASYFGRPRNKKKYTPEQQAKIDGKIKAAKKKFRIGEFAEKCDGTMDLCKCDSGNNQFTPLNWVSLYDWKPQVGVMAQSCYVPRTFGKVWEDTEDVDIFPIMGHMLGKVIANILASQLSGDQQRILIQQSCDELMEELDDEFMEASEAAAELATEAIDGAQKFVRPQLTKAGARNSKSDQSMIQTMHDHSVTLGAACKPAAEDKSTSEEKALASVLQKAQSIMAMVDDLAVRIKGLDISKVAEGEALKLADAIAPVLLEKAQASFKEITATLASKEEVIKLADAAAAASETVSGVAKRLEVVEKGPAISLPVSRPALGVTGGAPAVEGDLGKLADEIAVLTKMQNESGDPLVKEALGKELFLKKVKVGSSA